MKKVFTVIMMMFSLLLMVSCFSENEEEDIYYTVTFIGFDKSVIKEEIVKKGENATPPEPLDISGYLFVKWDKDFLNVETDLTVEAIYQEETLKMFNVIFLDNQGVILKVEQVIEGKNAQPPNAPLIAGYTFTGWDKDYSVIKEDLTVKALYEEAVYTVTFLDINNEIIKTEKLKYQEDAIAPEAPVVDGFAFLKWDQDFKEVEKDLIIKPVYKEVFIVTFLNKDDKVIKTISVLKGETITPPNPPSVYGYNFVGWDQDFTDVASDLIVKPLYEIKTYEVKFISDEKEIETQTIIFNEDAIAPIVEKMGYIFIGWDQSLTKIDRNLTVKAVWQKVIHASYLKEFSFLSYSSYNDLLATLETEDNLYYTFNNVKYGGSRGTDELVYYDQSLSHNTNIYGLEVAINQDGLVVEKATKVTIPEGGFVLSGHGKSLTLLDDRVKIGDYIVYANNKANIYRNFQINNIISLAIDLDKLKLEIIKSDNNLLALDYVEIEKMYNEVVNIFNGLLNNYTFAEFNLAEELLLTIYFMLIEPKAATIRAMWHYPTRSTGFNEMNSFEIGKYLDKVKSIGINRIYLNTNFNGSSIYKSEYLTQRLTANYTYEGYKDYLEAFISEAHLRDIEVYAWTNTLIAGDGMNNPFYSSRGWLLKGFNGEDNYGGMYYLDISNDEVQEFLSDIFNELASNYDLDGIEYDFIRFPVGRLNTYTGGSTIDLLDWGWTDSFQNKFKEKYNLTGDLKQLVTTNAIIRNNWLQFKRDLLSETTKMISTTIKNANPNIKISAAVMDSLTGAKNTYLQDWEKWIIEGFVEELNPMIYTANNSGLEQNLIEMKKNVKDYADIVVGIFPQGSGGGLSMVAEQIAIIENLNVNGVAQFSSRHLFSNHLKNAFVGMHRDYLVLPTATDEKIFNAYLFNIKEKTEGYYIYKVDDPNLNNLIVTINSFNSSETIFEKMTEIINIINLISDETIKNKLIKEHDIIASYLNKN